MKLLTAVIAALAISFSPTVLAEEKPVEEKKVGHVIYPHKTGAFVQVVSKSTQENLTAKQNELFYLDGTPFPEGEKYHIHPTKGPMVGAFHIQEPHSFLTFSKPITPIPILPSTTPPPLETDTPPPPPPQQSPSIGSGY